MFKQLLKNLSKVIALLASQFYFSIQLYFKMNIKLVYFITTNPFFYCFYLSCVVFTFFSFKQLGYYYFFSGFFIAYFFAQSLQLYLLCNVKISRDWLKSFLGNQFLTEHFGDNSCAKPLIMLLIRFTMVSGIEFTSFYIEGILK